MIFQAAQALVVTKKPGALTGLFGYSVVDPWVWRANQLFFFELHGCQCLLEALAEGEEHTRVGDAARGDFVGGGIGPASVHGSRFYRFNAPPAGLRFASPKGFHVLSRGFIPARSFKKSVSLAKLEQKRRWSFGGGLLTTAVFS